MTHDPSDCPACGNRDNGLMTAENWTDQELQAWLDELLPPERMAEIETALRDSRSLQSRLAGVAASRDGQAHTLGDIWRRNQLSCPPRSELGGFILGTLDGAIADYIEFHLRTVGCRYCVANVADLEQASESAADHQTRRRRFFESSAGLLRGD